MKRKNGSAQRIARERIYELFLQAKKRFSTDPSLSHRYVKLARTMGMKHRVPIPRDLRPQFCKKCLHYLVAGKNCRVRTQEGHIVYTCLECKSMRRFVYRK